MENSIGVLPQEMEAFNNIQLMLGLGYGRLMLLTLGQVIIFHFYNSAWHPMSRIIAKPKKRKVMTERIEMEEMEAIMLPPNCPTLIDNAQI